MEKLVILLIDGGILALAILFSLIFIVIVQIISCSIFKINLLQTLYNKLEGKGGIVKWQN